MALTVTLIVIITAYSYKEDNERHLVSLLRGTEMPYTTFERLSNANQKTFIENGGKVSKE